MSNMKHANGQERRWADDAFSQWWKNYPRKVGKAAAQREWNKIRPTPELVEKMLTALEWQIAQPEWQDLQYVPHGRTYLHNERWDDEPPKRASVAKAEPYHWRTCTHSPKCGSARECNILNAARKTVAS